MLRVLFLTAITLLASGNDSLARAGKKPVIAVLYFDNDTGDSSFDVLQKGFADMLITDLSSSPSLTLVERDKLQALLGEIKLQRKKYFDKKTAVKLGKGLGARYAITGSFVAMKPKIRINSRLVEVSTGKIIFGTNVSGKPSEIFDLEQELVKKFLAGLKLRFDEGAPARTKVPDVKTVIEYSKGIDLMDQGRIEEASKQMKTVVSKAPSFALARVRRAELIKRYELLKKRNVDLGAQSLRELRARADAFLARNPLHGLDEKTAKHYLAYRMLRGQLILVELEKHLTPGRTLRTYRRRAKDRRRAIALAQSYFENGRTLIKEIEAFEIRFTRTINGRRIAPSMFMRLPEDERARLRMSGIELPSSTSVPSAIWSLADFTLLGTANTKTKKPGRYTIGPPLALVDKKRGRQALKILAEGWKAADRAAKSTPHLIHQAKRLLELWADYYFFLGQRDKGIAKLQEVIDRYPDPKWNGSVERRIERELGLEHDNSRKSRERYFRGLKGCHNMDINVGTSTVFYERRRRKGFEGIKETVREVEKACKNAAKPGYILRYTYKRAALVASEIGYCKEFEHYIGLAASAGLAASEVAAWRRRAPCPAKSKVP